MNQPNRSRRAFSGCMALAATAGTALSAGCSGWTHLDTGTQTVASPANPSGVLDVRTANGSVEVKAADVSEIVVTATIKAAGQDRLQRTRVVVAPSDAGGVRVFVEWPDGRRRGNEGCSLVIQTPRTLSGSAGLIIDTSNGGVAVAGQNGPLHVDTSNGSIRVTDHGGSVNADTSNGRIEIEHVRGDVRLDTSNGRIEATDISGIVHADTSNGSIIVRLAKDCSSPFDLSTSNGSVRVEVGTAFAGLVDAQTSNGGVRVQGAVSLDGTKSRMKAVFGRKDAAGAGAGGVAVESGGKADAAKSTIHTSNGAIDVIAAQ